VTFAPRVRGEFFGNIPGRPDPATIFGEKSKYEKIDRLVRDLKSAFFDRKRLIP
jgi:hypothetical protein